MISYVNLEILLIPYLSHTWCSIIALFKIADKCEIFKLLEIDQNYFKKMFIIIHKLRIEM